MTLQPPLSAPANETAHWVLLKPVPLADDDILDFSDADDAEDLTVRPWSILIVDDDDEVHRAVELALMGVKLHDRPLHLTHCLSAGEARKQLIGQSPGIDLVLLDVVMETPDAGLTLLDDMRAAGPTHALPVLLHTGQPGEAPERMVRSRYDISGYLTKTTVTRQGLIDALSSILGGQSSAA